MIATQDFAKINTSVTPKRTLLIALDVVIETLVIGSFFVLVAGLMFVL